MISSRNALSCASAALAFLVVAACRAKSEPAPAVRVAAASDLTAAFEALRPSFRQQFGSEVSFSFGSSGLLAQQIVEGAPFDLFASANQAFVDRAVASGACDRATRARYARGRLALVWSRGGAASPPTKLAELEQARFRKIAVANPEHAPYGKAAKEALIAVGVWANVEPRLVYAENVRQALQFVETGNAEAGIVAHALVSRQPQGSFLDVDPALHAPLDQALVVCTRGANAAGGRAFARWVLSPSGAQVLSDHGFLPSGNGAAVH